VRGMGSTIPVCGPSPVVSAVGHYDRHSGRTWSHTAPIYAGLSTYTVQDLCRRGELRHVKAGRIIRIRREWADTYMAAREREPLQ
jgi:excisionase family DNA binding protein